MSYGEQMNFAAIFNKIKENVFLIPAERFDSLTTDKSYKDSFIYLLICFALSFPIRWGMMFLDYKEPGFNLIPISFETKLFVTFFGTLIGTIIGIPLIYLFYLVQHFLLKLFGAKEGLLKSIQVFIYGSTPGLLFGSIPLVGIVTSLVILSNTVLGSARIHQIDWWKAILAIVVIPILIAILLAILVVTAIGNMPIEIFSKLVI